MGKKIKSKETLYLNGCGNMEFMLSPSQLLCPWAGSCHLLLDQAAPNETFCEEEKNGAVIKQN